MLAATMLTAASCSDFDDYNDSDTYTASNSQAGNLLWENISNNPQLTDFAKLVARTGFNQYLSQSRAYTVWAPVNGKFKVADYEAMNDSTLLAQFVKNHIAEFNYVASGDLGQEPGTSVYMLNGKSYQFAGNGSYTFDGVPVGEVNMPNSNGILHLLNGTTTFYPNLYEYLSLSSKLLADKAEDERIDSLAKYFKRYETTTLDKEKSEKGPMVNGMQTYVDSVMVTSNSLVRYLNAQMENEDSSYTFLMPTNKAYRDMYDRVKQYYKYASATVMMDATLLDKAYAKNATGDKSRNGDNFQKKADEININYWTDSVTRRQIVRNLLFSNTYGYNTFITQRTPQAGDSIYSTGRRLLSNPGEVLDDHLVGPAVKMSNGIGRLVDSVAIHPWETYSGEIEVSPRTAMVNAFTARATNIVSHRPAMAEQLLGPGNTEFRWTLVEGSNDRTTPDIFIALPGVQSIKYNFYVVLLPYVCGNDSNRVTPMNFDLSYCRLHADGVTPILDNYHFSKKYLDSQKAADQNPGTLDKNTAFSTADPSKIDTLYLGQFEFPLSYDGLGNVYPTLYISSPVSSNSDRKNFSREFRIFSIILRPVEQDAYMDENNQ